MSKKIDDWVKNELIEIDPPDFDEKLSNAIKIGLRTVSRKQKIILYYWLYTKLWKASYWSYQCYLGKHGRAAFKDTKKITKKEYEEFLKKFQF